MGWDRHYGFQLYMSDPSGNYGGWKGTCIGNNSQVSNNHVDVLLCNLNKIDVTGSSFSLSMMLH